MTIPRNDILPPPRYKTGLSAASRYLGQYGLYDLYILGEHFTSPVITCYLGSGTSDWNSLPLSKYPEVKNLHPWFLEAVKRATPDTGLVVSICHPDGVDLYSPKLKVMPQVMLALWAHEGLLSDDDKPMELDESASPYFHVVQYSPARLVLTPVTDHSIADCRRILENNISMFCMEENIQYITTDYTQA